MKPQPKGWYRNREKTILLRALQRLGARIEWYGQRMRNPDKRRDVEQAKSADRLAPNGNGAGTGGVSSPVVNIWLPAERDGPNPLWHWDGTW
jgi:hypothetical protein